SQLDQVFHGTTIATNIVIEHNGARVGMITTEGYRDILHIARHKTPLNFSNYQDLPWQRYPIVRRRHRLTVPERITRDGTVLVPLDEERTREQVLRRTGLHLMTSASGVATAEGAIARPVNLLMSGPVAGVVGGIWAGRQAGYDNVITLDVGGTSADIGLAQEGRLRMKHLLDTKVGPYQAMIPMVDVDTIGAGGGSIA